MADKEPSQDYIEGFNKGYVLREHKPDLALSLSQTKFPESEYEYGKGLKDGIQQKELELIKAKGMQAPKKDKDNDPEIER